jgi:hypothetical protein
MRDGSGGQVESGGVKEMAALNCGFQRIADRITNDRGQRSDASRTRFQTIADSVPMIADSGG